MTQLSREPTPDLKVKTTLLGVGPNIHIYNVYILKLSHLQGVVSTYQQLHFNLPVYKAMH